MLRPLQTENTAAQMHPVYEIIALIKVSREETHTYRN